jgi:hypothetical protein
MTENNERADRSEATDPTDPTEQSERNDPTEPIEQADPTDPIDKIEPLDAMQRIECSEQMDSLDVPPLLPFRDPSAMVWATVLSPFSSARVTFAVPEIVDDREILARSTRASKTR